LGPIFVQNAAELLMPVGSLEEAKTGKISQKCGCGTLNAGAFTMPEFTMMRA
jgi:hypothetical protein